MEKDIENSSEAIKQLQKWVKDVNIAMLTTMHDNDELHSRPMATADVDDEGNLWFFTDEFSSKVNEIAVDKHVNVTYADKGENLYLSISGKAILVDDRDKMKALYTPVIKAWFPDGIDDPRLGLLKITPHHSEYWDSSSNKMVTLYRIAKAIITKDGEDIGEHGKLDI